MSAKLFKIPLVRWVRATIDKMNASERDDIEHWKSYWLWTYAELGGQATSGSKGCPQYAAFGLWRLGRIVDSGRPLQNWSLQKINAELGKNATYAFLALNLLETGWGIEDKESLWSEVRKQYLKLFREPPAESQQGAVKVATVLFAEGQIVSRNADGNA